MTIDRNLLQHKFNGLFEKKRLHKIVDRLCAGFERLGMGDGERLGFIQRMTEDLLASFEKCQTMKDEEDFIREYQRPEDRTVKLPKSPQWGFACDAFPSRGLP